MKKSKYIDYNLIDKYPNKYNIQPSNIKNIKVLNWDRLQQYTWLNQALDKPCWCHIDGAGEGCFGSEDSFWIGFYQDGTVRHWFSSHEDMCDYRFKKFYDINDIENQADMEIQAKAIKFLNMLIDEEIISRPLRKEKNK